MGELNEYNVTIVEIGLLERLLAEMGSDGVINRTNLENRLKQAKTILTEMGKYVNEETEDFEVVGVAG